MSLAAAVLVEPGHGPSVLLAPELLTRRFPGAAEISAPVRDIPERVADRSTAQARFAGLQRLLGQAVFMLDRRRMPASETILAGATTIANEWRPVAVAWHGVLAVLLTAFFSGWRPSTRIAGYFLSAPLMSVSAAAWVGGNPFNGTVFVVLFLFVLRLASRLSKDPVRSGTPIQATLGVILVAFGCGYPHFLETDHWMTYAYAAPLGVLPCPTLSAVIGATLISGLLGSVTWSITLAAAGLVYGAVGVFVLGVQLDYALLAGALVLAVLPSTRSSGLGKREGGHDVNWRRHGVGDEAAFMRFRD